VQAVGFVSDDAAYAGTMTMRWELAGVDGGTRVDVMPTTSRMESTRRITPPGWRRR
jgi:hypothetical protein